MDEKTAQPDRFDWRLPVYAGLSALILFYAVHHKRRTAPDTAVRVCHSPNHWFLNSDCRHSKEGTAASSSFVDACRLRRGFLGIVQKRR
jgi:hypothetical protein